MLSEYSAVHMSCRTSVINIQKSLAFYKTTFLQKQFNFILTDIWILSDKVKQQLPASESLLSFFYLLFYQGPVACGTNILLFLLLSHGGGEREGGRGRGNQKSQDTKEQTGVWFSEFLLSFWLLLSLRFTMSLSGKREAEKTIEKVCTLTMLCLHRTDTLEPSSLTHKVKRIYDFIK